MLYSEVEKPKLASVPSGFSQNSSRSGLLGRNNNFCMRSAIGFIIVLWGLSHFFGQPMNDLGQAASASFKTVEVAAEVAQQKLSEI